MYIICIYNTYIIYIYNIYIICIYYIYIGTPLDIKKLIFLLHTYQHITAYSSAMKFTRRIPGNVCVQEKDIMEPMHPLVLMY